MGNTLQSLFFDWMLADVVPYPSVLYTEMKKKWFLYSIVVFFVICALILCFFVRAPKIDIPFFSQDEICFGSSSWEAARAFGTPIATTGNVADTDKTSREYRTTILGHDAVITGHFSPLDQLVNLAIQWECDSETEARALFSAVYGSISERYSCEPGFHCEETGENAIGYRTVIMGVNYGATGIDFRLEWQGTAVTVRCNHLY